MPGHVAHEEVPVRRTLVIRPIQANLTIDDNLIGKMDAYCKFKCGHHKTKTEVCKDAGKWPFWNTVLKLSTKDELYAECQVKNKKWAGLRRKTIATCKIPLREVGQTVGTEGHMTEWFSINQNMKPVGRILLDISYETMDQIPLKNTVVDPNIRQEPETIGPNSKSITQNPQFNEIYNLSKNPPPLSVDPTLNQISKVNQYPSDVYQNLHNNQIPHSNLSQIPHSNLNQIPHSNVSQVPHSNISQIPHSNVSQIPTLNQNPNLNQHSNINLISNLSQTPHMNQVSTLNQTPQLIQGSTLSQNTHINQVPTLHQTPQLIQSSGLSQNTHINQASQLIQGSGLSQNPHISQVSTSHQNLQLN